MTFLGVGVSFKDVRVPYCKGLPFQNVGVPFQSVGVAYQI